MYKRIIGFVGLFYFSLFALAQTPPSPDGVSRAWSLAHPDAGLLLGVNVRAIRESAVGKSLNKNMSQTGMGMMALPALQLLRDIDEVLVSAPAPDKLAPHTAAGAKPGNAANSPVLIVLTGHFPAAHVQGLMRGAQRTYKGVRLCASMPGGVNSEVALLDENTLIFGDSASLAGAIDRRQHGNPNPSPLVKRAAALAPGNDVWLLATAPPSAFSPAGFQPAGVNIEAMASEIRGIEAGLAFREGLKLALNLSTKDAESANRLVREITSKLQSSMEGKVDSQQTAEILRKMNISAEGSQIRVKFAMSQAEMDRAVALMQKMNADRLKAGGTVLVPQQTPQRADPGAFKVYGMGENVVEIPASPRE